MTSKKSTTSRSSKSVTQGYTGNPPESWENDDPDIMWGPPFSTNPERKKQYQEQMEQWFKDPYTLDDRWKERARRELNESFDTNVLRQEVIEFRKLVAALKTPPSGSKKKRKENKKLLCVWEMTATCALCVLVEEPGLNSRMDDHFLLAFLRSKRHEMKPALASLVKYYRMRKVNSQYFQLFLPSEHTREYTMGALNILEGYDLLGRVICYFTANFNPAELSNVELIKMLIHLLDTVVVDPRVQVAGLTILVNLKQQSLAHAKIVTVQFLKLMLQIFQGSFPVRMKLVLLCHGSFLFRATFAIIRPFIPEKFKERIFIMGSDTKKLLNFIPVNMIPAELNGELTNIRPDTMMERITLIEDRLREWYTYGLDDAVNLDRMPSLQLDPDPGPDVEKLHVEEAELQRRIDEEVRKAREAGVEREERAGSTTEPSTSAKKSTSKSPKK